MKLVRAPLLAAGELPALSIRQPWAWAILHAGKNIENRTWSTNYRGRFWLHVSKTCSLNEYREGVETIVHVSGYEPPPLEDLPRGAIIGSAELVTVYSENSPGPHAWFGGPYGFRLANVRPLSRPVPCAGRQLWFRLPPDVENACRDLEVRP